MKHLTFLFLLVTSALLVVSCGKSDSGSSKKSTMSKLNAQGIYITSSGSSTSQNYNYNYDYNYNNTNTYNGGYGYGETLRIECRFKDSRKVTNQKRMDLLVQLFRENEKRGYIKIGKRRYDLGSVSQLLAQAHDSLAMASSMSGYGQYGNQYGGYNNNTYQNRDNQCPSSIIAQGSVMTFQNYR